MNTDQGVLSLTVTGVEIPSDVMDQVEIEGYFEDRVVRLIREYNDTRDSTRPEIGGGEVIAEFIPTEGNTDG